MGIAENPNKISNIVEGSFSVFDEMYKQYDLFDRYYGNQMIDFNVADISDDIKNLPLHIMKPSRNNRYSRDELVMIMKSIVYQLETKNKNASLKQTLKGILTSGPSKSVNYAYQKVAKRFRSK